MIKLKVKKDKSYLICDDRIVDYFWIQNELYEIKWDAETYERLGYKKVGDWATIKKNFPKIKKKDVINMIKKERQEMFKKSILDTINNIMCIPDDILPKILLKSK